MLNLKNRKARKGFSLVELVVVILIIAILAVAVFAGGSAAIKKAQVSRTTSDLHNFSIAIETAMNETPKVANMNKEADFDAIIKAVKNNLPADYALERLAENAAGNTVTKQNTGSTDDTYVIYKSAKTDAWDNPYYVIFDAAERHEAGISEFYITVVSAGANAQTTITHATGKGIEADDIFLLVQYTDGDVAAVTYNVDKAALQNGTETALGVTTKGTAAGTNGQYIALPATINVDGTANVCPVNFQPAA